MVMIDRVSSNGLRPGGSHSALAHFFLRDIGLPHPGPVGRRSQFHARSSFVRLSCLADTLSNFFGIV